MRRASASPSDLLNGGDKNWGLHSPYRDMAYEAGQRAGAVENCLNQSLSRAAHGRLDALLRLDAAKKNGGYSGPDASAFKGE